MSVPGLVVSEMCRPLGGIVASAVMSATVLVVLHVASITLIAVEIQNAIRRCEAVEDGGIPHHPHGRVQPRALPCAGPVEESATDGGRGGWNVNIAINRNKY